MSQQKLCTVSELKRKIVQFALVVAVQVALVLCLDLFANGLVGLGPLRLPIGVAGYRYGGRVCLLTVFMPGVIAWNLNEAVDEAKKQEPLGWKALILQLSEICRKALRRLPGALLVIPFLFLVEWMQAGTLHSILLAVVYALLVLLDFWMVRRFWSMLPLPEAAPKSEPGAGR